MQKILTFLFATVCVLASAQDTLRVGYVDRQTLLIDMPLYADAQKAYNELAKNYADEYDRIEAEYNKKVKEYIAESKQWSEPVKLARQAEITEYEERLLLFRKRYTDDLQRQRTRLEQPAHDRLSAAIAEVASEQAISLVLDIATPLFVAAPCIDITAAVKEKLKTSDANNQ